MKQDKIKRTLSIVGIILFVIVIGSPDSPYLKRWWVIPRNRFFNIYLHHIIRSDDDRAAHSHPWINLSIILTSGYDELVPMEGHYPFQLVRFRREPGAVLFRWPSAFHRLEISDPRYTAWTLFLTGPVVRQWFFACPQGLVHWKVFTSPADKGQIGRGCD